MQIYFAFFGELGAIYLGFCTDKTKPPVPCGTGGFYQVNRWISTMYVG